MTNLAAAISCPLRWRHVNLPTLTGSLREMTYRRCGRSGLLLPAISLGLWQNFGDDRPIETQGAICPSGLRPRRSPTSTSPTTTARPTAAPRRTSAVSFGPTSGLRDELVISTKAGWDMWPGPYGDLGSRSISSRASTRALIAWASTTSTSSTTTASIPTRRWRKRWARSTRAVRQGKALYVGISSYSDERTREAIDILRGLGHAAADPPAVVLDAQPLDRGPAARRARAKRASVASPSRPSAQGLLTDRYLDGVPEGSRAATGVSSPARRC